MTHLTHLSVFGAKLNVYDAHQTNIVLKLFADACPTLAFVQLGICNAYGWVSIKRQTYNGIYNGRYVGWDLIKSVRGIQMEDWSKHLDPSTPNLNRDKRVLIPKNSTSGRQ